MATSDVTIGLLFANAADRQLVAGFLRDTGYDVRTGPFSVDRSEDWDGIGLVIADVHAAHAVGRQLLALKDRSRAIFLPLLIALPRDVASEQWLEAGFDDVLRLPISKAELAARIRVVLRQRRQAVDQRSLEQERRQAIERALKRSEELARKILESSQDCIDVLDVDARIVSTNPAGKRAFDTCDPMATPGTIWTDLWDDGYRERARAAFGAALAGGIGRLIAPGRAPDGDTKWWNAIVTPILGADGRPERLLAVSRDITDETLVAEERERLLEREQKAREEAELASRIKDEFLTTVSHELRTPLNAALGWVHILENAPDGAGVEERAIATIRRNVEAQAQIVDDLLDVSRIMSGKLRVESRPVDLATVVRAAFESAQPAAKNKGVQIRLLANTEVVVRGDSNRLQQVVWNLISNAVKFTPRDGLVEIRLERAGGRVEIAVRDTGRGINRSFLPYVFDRFRQADGSATRTEGGLGLGLAIVREIVAIHGGTVTAESEGPGRGATFIVRLPELRPAEAQSTDEDESAASVAGDGSAASRRIDGTRILVVEDAPDSREMLEIVLNRAGSDVRACGSVDEAVRVFADWRPDAVVCDIGLPGDDGYALIGRVRALERGLSKRTPAVALTAFARAEDKARALAEGFDAHVAKPVEPSHLVAVVSGLLGRG